MEKVTDIINDSMLNDGFGNADFGNISKRDVIKYALLKYASNFQTGKTANHILKDLGLITTKNELSRRGKQYLFAAFNDGVSL
jgi:hypothetical protein